MEKVIDLVSKIIAKLIVGLLIVLIIIDIAYNVIPIEIPEIESIHKIILKVGLFIVKPLFILMVISYTKKLLEFLNFF